MNLGWLKPKRVAIVTLIATFFVSLLALSEIDLRYMFDKPRSPDIDSGRVMSVSVSKGTIVYVTPEELQRYRSVRAFGGYGMLVSFVGIAILKLAMKDVWN